MRVCYLTWGETPRSYGVFGSQILGQFIETKKQSPESEFHFISGVPIIHSGFVREKWKYKDEVKNVKTKLGDIKFHWIPIFFSQNVVHPTKFLFGFLFYGAEKILKNRLLKINPDIVHCRSYGSTHVALKIREKYKLSYKVIFDARGIYPEEYALRKGYDITNSNYLFFKNLEKNVLDNSDLTIAVSDTMKKHFQDLNAKRVECIYLSANTDKLVTKREYKEDHIVFGYVGALSEGTWHKTTELLKLYENLRKTVKNPKIHIITTSNHNEIKEIFKSIPEDEVYLSSTRTVDELKVELGKFNFGIMSYFNAKKDFEVTLSYTGFAIKSAEYLAAGLPLIINNKIGGITNLIEQYDLGVSYNPDTFEELTTTNVMQFYNDGRDTERSRLAEKLFSYSNNALRYRNMYEELLKSK